MALAAGKTAALTLEELSALSNEMAALVRAGVPLEAGLDRLGSELPNRLARSAEVLASRLAQGQSLTDVLRESPDLFPPVYAAVIEAGARSGRLALALEALTKAAKRVAELRQIAIASLVYPVLILLVAYGTLALYAWCVVPQYARMFIDLRAEQPATVRWLMALGGLDARWWLLPLVGLFAGLSWWWFRSARGALVAGRGGWEVLWLSPVRKVLAWSRWATIIDLLALLVEHDVELPPAVRLAVEAGGDPQLQRSTQPIVAKLEQGGSLDARELANAGWPPLLRWSLLHAGRRSSLLASLHFAANHYRRQAQDQFQWLRTYLPLLAALLLGSAVVVFLIVAVLGPWLKILYELNAATVN